MRRSDPKLDTAKNGVAARFANFIARAVLGLKSAGRGLARERGGSTSIEYSVIVAMLAVFMSGAASVGRALDDVFDSVSVALEAGPASGPTIIAGDDEPRSLRD